MDCAAASGASLAFYLSPLATSVPAMVTAAGAVTIAGALPGRRRSNFDARGAMIETIAGIVGLVLITVVLADAFQTIVLPRTVSSPIRLTVVFYRDLWRVWQRFGRLFSDRVQPTVMSVFGPLSLLVLLSTWAVLVIV